MVDAVRKCYYCRQEDCYKPGGLTVKRCGEDENYACISLYVPRINFFLFISTSLIAYFVASEKYPQWAVKDCTARNKGINSCDEVHFKRHGFCYGCGRSRCNLNSNDTQWV